MSVLYFTLMFLLVNLIHLDVSKENSINEIEKPNKIRVILDTDANNELDDQHAIAYLLFNGDTFNVDGITVNKTKNGGEIDKHYEEAERVVKLCGLYNHVEIYKGANGSFEEIEKD